MKEKNWEKMANECRELDKEKRRKDERNEQKKKDLGCRDHKQRMPFHGRGTGSSAFVVLMAGESIVDGPYCVQRR